MVAPKQKEGKEAILEDTDTLESEECKTDRGNDVEMDIPEVSMNRNGEEETEENKFNMAELILPILGFVCCSTLGVFSIVLALLSYTDHKNQDHDASSKKIRWSRCVAVLAIVSGLLLLVTGMAAVIFLGPAPQRSLTPQKGYQRFYHTVACEGNSVHLTCPDPGHRINIIRAFYGRNVQAGQVCNQYERQRPLLATCQSADSLYVMRERCDSKHECQVRASNDIFGDPCLDVVKYLEVEYDCQNEEGLKRGQLEEPGIRDEGVQYVGTACEGQSLRLHCPKGQVVSILVASYGRSQGAICPQGPIRTRQCHAQNSDYKTRRLCEGKNHCRITASNAIFGDPCEGTFKYLRIAYNCIHID